MQRAYHFKYKSENCRFGIVTFITSSLYKANQLWWRFCDTVKDDIILSLEDTYISEPKEQYTYNFRTRFYTNHVTAYNYTQAWEKLKENDDPDRVYDVEDVS